MLVLSGRADLRTPLEDARRTALQYPNAKVLAVPGVGHSVLSTDFSGCAVKGTIAFLRGQRGRQVLAHLARRALQNLSAPYAPASIGDLRPTGASGLAGRTFSAVSVTLAGIGYDSAFAPTSEPLPGPARRVVLRDVQTKLELHARRVDPRRARLGHAAARPAPAR